MTADVTARFDDLAAQIQDWADSVLALDERQCPSELRYELQDLAEECVDLLDAAEPSDRERWLRAVFVHPEMVEVVDRYARLRRILDETIGRDVLELIDTEGAEPEVIGMEDEDEEDEDEDE